MILDILQAAYKNAMIAKDALAKEAINSTIAQIKNKKIDLQRDPTDDECIKILQKEIKTRKEGAEFYKQAGKDQDYADETTKIVLLETYLPQMLSLAELENIVQEYIVQLNITDVLKQRGALINAIKEQYGSAVDGALLNQIITAR